MLRSHRGLDFWGTFLGIAIAGVPIACGGAPRPQPIPAPKPVVESKPIAPAPTVAPEPALLPLRVGALVPVERPSAELRVIARKELGEEELLELELPDAEEIRGDAPWDLLALGAEVSIIGDPSAVAFIGAGYDDASSESTRVAKPAVVPKGGSIAPVRLSPDLWVKRRKSGAGLAGTLYTPATPEGVLGPYRARQGGAAAPGSRIPFTVTTASAAPVLPLLEQAWARALARRFDHRSGPFNRFAADRVLRRYQPKKAAAHAASVDRVVSQGDLQELMNTMTGRLSVQEALQRDRALLVAAQKTPATVPIDKIRLPALTVHPWADLAKPLKPGPEEPLARATPAEFYFARARGVTGLLDLLDRIEEWGGAAADVLDGRSEDRGTLARYHVELGLVRTGLTRTLGPELVSDLAIVGSDPYVNEGTDVTVLFHVKSPALFQAALEGTLARVITDVGPAKDSTFVHEGVTVTVHRSADGRLRQHRATVDDLHIVSNSPGAIRRVISTIRGTHPRLSDEADFRYMLARDPDTTDDVLAYLGDKFVAAVVGPKQKIGEARRQLAFAELSVPGYAALLSGFLAGKSPGSVDELVRSGWLAKTELRHADGAAIEWAPGQAARSAWGSVEALEPLIDRPEVVRVTKAEQAGYEAFARGYESLWSDKIDPVALRVRTATGPAGSEIRADLRVLPLLRNEYREFTEVAGNARIEARPLPSGLRLVVGIGKDAPLRRELSQASRGFSGGRLAFDWLGDYALLGIANRNEVANAAHLALSREIEMPAPTATRPVQDELPKILAEFPLYAAVAIKSRMAAAVALTAIREISRDAAPGVVTWSTAPAYRGSEIVSVGVRESVAQVSIYYALLEQALVVSLSEAGLHDAIDQIRDAPPVPISAAESAEGAGQALLELAGDSRGALHRVATWLASTGLFIATEDSRQIVEAVLRGIPETASDPTRVQQAMRRCFGVVARTPDGQDYTLAPDGVRDPVRGTWHAPIWPELPVPGSSVERVIGRLAAIRTALSFDDEPGSPPEQHLQSLHARVTIGLTGLGGK